MSIGKTLDKDAHLFFMNLVGVMKEIKLAYLDKEFDKLALFTDNKRIDKKTMEEVFSSVPEVSSFALMDAISAKDIKKALLLLRKETESGAFLPLTIGLIARHTRQLLQAKILIKEGVMGKALGAPLGLNPVIAERLGRAAANFNEKVLEDAIILLSDADYLTKTGQGGIELIEEILIRLCKK
ncbi:MAG: DNA polymerase III subunit delta, partial [Selenomonadaceae bacterium]|nr:DNA polymerase III subunit delta [Selenomonadaceae bacterium]